MTMTSQYHHALYQPPSGAPCLHTVRDAAEYFGLSASAVRRELRSHGMCVGHSVCGMVAITVDGRTGYVPVTRSVR